MGAYSLADDISAMPTTELLAPLNRVLFPALVRVKDNATELKRAFLLSQGVQTLVGLPAGVGLALVANELVLVLLGEKWAGAAPFLGIFALMNVANALASSSIYLLLTLDHAKKLAIYSWTQVLLFFLAALLVFPIGGALQVAWIRLALSLLGLLTYFYILVTTLRTLRVVELAGTFYRPAISSLVMAACVLLAAGHTTLTGAALLALKVLVGAISYAVSTAVLWIAVRRPYGPESYAFNIVKARFDAKRGS
jgi:O-antigen/teichoic acid export membrane protein